MISEKDVRSAMLAEARDDSSAEYLLILKEETSLKKSLVEKLLRPLSKDQRDLMRLRYYEDLSNKEIARIKGESENLIAVKFHNMTKKIANTLARMVGVFG